MKIQNSKLILYALFILGGSGSLSYYLDNTNTKEFYRAIKTQEEINKAAKTIDDSDLDTEKPVIVFEILYNELVDMDRIAERPGQSNLEYKDAYSIVRAVSLRTNKLHTEITVKLLQELGVQQDGGQIVDVLSLRVAYRK